MKKGKKITVFSVEEFSVLDADKIARMMRKNKSLRIEGDTPGVDRKIIKSKN